MKINLRAIFDRIRCYLNFPVELAELNRSLKDLKEKTGNCPSFSLEDFRAYHGVLSFDALYGLQLKAREEAAAFIKDQLGSATLFRSREEVLAHAISKANTDGTYCEFGVASGKSINFISSMVKTTVFGFDSFEGMPEKWNAWEAGSLSMKGQMPAVNPNVKLMKGLFQNTIGEGRTLFQKKPISFCHIDCDLYSSTRFVLFNLIDLMVPGTIIVFDEFYNHPTWKECEYKAWFELVSTFKISFEYLGYNAYESSVSLRILEIGRPPQSVPEDICTKDFVMQKKYHHQGAEISMEFYAKDIYVVDAVFSGQEYPLHKVTGYIKPSVILDIGANAGATALLFASAYPESVIHAFEPYSRAFELLKKNTSAFPNVRCYPVGIYDKTCEKDLYLGKYQTAASSIFKNSNSSEEKTPIRLIGIKEFMDQNKIREMSVLKIDAEGCEEKIIKAINPIEKVDYIFFEYHSEKDRMDLDLYLSRDFYLFFAKVHRPNRGTCGYVSRRITNRYPELVEEPILIPSA